MSSKSSETAVKISKTLFFFKYIKSDARDFCKQLQHDSVFFRSVNKRFTEFAVNMNRQIK